MVLLDYNHGFNGF